MRLSFRYALVVALLGGLVACGSDHSAPTQPSMNLSLTPTSVAGIRAPTPTPVPMMPTPTPNGAGHVVNVGQGGTNFVDTQSGSNMTSIHTGQTVQWVWVSGPHSSTSGVCCSANGMWDSGVMSSGTFSHTFSAPGNYPYFCVIHTTMMTGVVMVSP
jgi:plastocyanin